MAESIRTIPSGFEVLPRSLASPTGREWRLHILLFSLTIVTTILSGVMLVMPDLQTPDPPLSRPIDYIFYIPHVYLNSVLEFFHYMFAHPALIIQGTIFSASLIAILFSHEMGHYL